MTSYEISQQYWKRNIFCLPVVFLFIALSFIPGCSFLAFVAFAALGYQVFCLFQQVRYGRKADREWKDESAR